MCIIVRNLTGKPVPTDIADRCVSINPDGFGIAYLDSKNKPNHGGLLRTLDMGIGEKILKTETRPYVAHCRYATVGDKTAEFIHPFQCGPDRLLFHNGTLTVKDASVCDSKQLADALSECNDASAGIVLDSLDHCRFALVDSHTGESSLHGGKWHSDLGIDYSKDNVLKDDPYSGYQYDYDYENWTSNNYATKSGKRHTVGVYGTLKYGRGNHHLIKDSDFLGYGYTRNKMRLCINGLPYMIRGKHRDGVNVELEVYSVTDSVLQQLDMLEGHPNFYRRDKIGVTLERHDNQTGVGNMIASVYMVDSSYDSGVYHRAF